MGWKGGLRTTDCDPAPRPVSGVTRNLRGPLGLIRSRTRSRAGMLQSPRQKTVPRYAAAVDPCRWARHYQLHTMGWQQQKRVRCPSGEPSVAAGCPSAPTHLGSKRLPPAPSPDPLPPRSIPAKKAVWYSPMCTAVICNPFGDNSCVGDDLVTKSPIPNWP